MTIKGEIHARRRIGRAPTFVDEVLGGVIARVLFRAEEELGEGRTGKKTRCEKMRN